MHCSSSDDDDNDSVDNETLDDKLDGMLPLLVNRADKDKDEDDAMFLLLALWSFRDKVKDSIDKLKETVEKELRAQQRKNRTPPVAKDRVSWFEFNEKITDDHFRRMFRMSRTTFGSLCHKINAKVGDKEIPVRIILD